MRKILLNQVLKNYFKQFDIKIAFDNVSSFMMSFFIFFYQKEKREYNNIIVNKDKTSLFINKGYKIYKY